MCATILKVGSRTSGRVLRAASATLLILLAACATDPPPEDEGIEFEGIPIDSEGGSIRGIVVDATITPLADAEIGLESGATQRTNERGAFAFGGLEPGFYVIHVSKPGYFPATATATVSEAEPAPPTVKVVLDTDIATTAYVQTVRVQGFLECGTGLPGGGSWSVCQAPVGVVEILCKGAEPIPPTGVCIDPVNEHQGVLEVHVERVPSFAQAEAVWRPTSSGADVLTWGKYVRHPGTTEFSNGTSTTGPSPVVMPWSQQNLTKLDVGGQRIMVYQVFPESGGVGNVVLEQEVELFVTTFYQFLPPAGWQFSLHGEPLPP